MAKTNDNFEHPFTISEQADICNNLVQIIKEFTTHTGDNICSGLLIDAEHFENAEIFM